MKICIDAGHYGKYNQSPTNKEYYESEVMLKLTKYQKEYLEEYENVSVVLTRKDEKDIEVFKRGTMAKGCDLFISNHSNACDSGSIDYPIVFYNYDNYKNSNVLAQKLSETIQKLMKTTQKGKISIKKNKSNNDEYYGVLRGARSVGVKYYFLLEHSFHTNKKATLWLLDDKNLREMAKAEVEEIAKFFNLKKKTTDEVFYRVIVGSYKDKENALKQQETLKKYNISSFLECYRQ